MDQAREQPDQHSLMKALAGKIEESIGAGQEPEDRPMKEILDLICSLLTALGIEKVSVRYDGSGDEGLIEEIEFEPTQGAIPHGLERLVEEYVLSILPVGFEIDEGSFGSVVLSPSGSPRVDVEHSIRTAEYSPYSID